VAAQWQHEMQDGYGPAHRTTTVIVVEYQRMTNPPGAQDHTQPLVKETKMNKGYWVTTYRNISDPTALAAYAELATAAIAAAGGRFVVRGMPSEVHEQGLSERTIVIEFPSVEHAVAAYASTAYQHALAALGRGAERDVRIVAGAE